MQMLAEVFGADSGSYTSGPLVPYVHKVINLAIKCLAWQGPVEEPDVRVRYDTVNIMVTRSARILCNLHMKGIINASGRRREVRNALVNSIGQVYRMYDLYSMLSDEDAQSHSGIGSSLNDFVSTCIVVLNDNQDHFDVTKGVPKEILPLVSLMWSRHLHDPDQTVFHEAIFFSPSS